MISWLYGGDGWGTRERAIPGEWALLLLIVVLGAVLGLIVLWFTLLHHKRTVRRRNRRRTELAMLDVGPAADEADAGAETEAAAEADTGAETETAAEAATVAEPEEAATVAEPEAAAEGAQAAQPEAAQSPEAAAGQDEVSPPKALLTGASAQRKLTDEILSRVEAELAGRERPRWKELAALVHREFGVSVHPSSIQKAVKRRRLAQAGSQTT
ncbi:hypothetical protein KDK95_09130 [Actinospica sp. MGRD01-02]|uniref:Uncharacterized protein n=1 Tax=Actinospica acidithermotolerans TaxID=2828514 RepID=A0A941E9G8_9ACTN|nr:hypothetical protein [Actinospica acidithermotolerans]MBR7826463.1 hypothetical protein [Actinospica acidithermotolerans]